MFPSDLVYGLWATKSKGVGLIVRAISFQDFQTRLCGPNPPTLQTGGQTGRRTEHCSLSKPESGVCVTEMMTGCCLLFTHFL